MADEEENSTHPRHLAAEIRKLWAEWKPHREAQSKRTFTAEDQEALDDLITSIGSVIMGQDDGGMDDLRRAHRALRGLDRGQQDRHVAAVAHCRWALWARRAADKRDPREKPTAWKERVEKNRKCHMEHAQALIHALCEEDPAFSHLRVLKVADAIGDAVAARANASPVGLLVQLIDQTRPGDDDKHNAAFGGASPDALKQSGKKKRQPGS